MFDMPNRGKFAMALMMALAGLPAILWAGNIRQSSVERYGLGGHIQAIGLRHGFHIETVALDSPADLDLFRPKDVIVRVDGEDIRSMDHLRAALAEAYLDEGEVEITYLRGGSLDPKVARCQLGRVARTEPKRRRSQSK